MEELIMSVETKIDWRVFDCKFSDNPQNAFEQLTYYLFCDEYNQKYGIFRYFNQPHIETNPIQVGDKLIGFQSKYYSNSINISSKKNELIEAVKGASNTYSGITTLYFYINHEFSPSSSKGEIKPKYQIEIEDVANKLGITIVWKSPSTIEAQLMLGDNLANLRELYFNLNSKIQNYWNILNEHKNDIFNYINTTVSINNNEIILQNNDFNMDDFFESEKQFLVVDGVAGVGKSALIKRNLTDPRSDVDILAFKSTDMDERDKENFAKKYGDFLLDDILSMYEGAKYKILYIDSAEMYFILENQNTFEDILKVFIRKDWKIIFSIRTGYISLFKTFLSCEMNIGSYDTNVYSYHIEPITQDYLAKISVEYNFLLPNDKNMLNILCRPFYLKLYLRLNIKNDEKLINLNKETFEDLIWDEIICNTKTQRDNLPIKREEAVFKLTKEILLNDDYSYSIKGNDDFLAFSELEKSGVLVKSNNAKEYYYGHDVFEELVVNHFFSEQYNRGFKGKEFFEIFNTSFRVRKYFRGWLKKFATIDEHISFIYEMIENKEIDIIWKDEILLTIISAEELENCFNRIVLSLSDNNYELLKKILLLINTCCRVVENEEEYLTKGIITPLRFSKPTGYAWKAILKYINDNKTKLQWDRELITLVVKVLDSWTKEVDNQKTENTGLCGSIALYLLEVLQKSDIRYDKNKDYLMTLKRVILNSAWMIQIQLNEIIETVINGIHYEDDSLYHMRTRRIIEAPKSYVDLAKMIVSDVYNYGIVPFVMPEKTIQLMNKLWLKNDEQMVVHSYDKIDENFGLYKQVSFNYYPPSAFKTPLISLLHAEPILTTNFIVDFFNKAGEAYKQSYLNENYQECINIALQIDDKTIIQTASSRLWQMYRGNSAGPNLINCLLMDFEFWLLDYAKKSSAAELETYCKDILSRSKNVMLTAVIVSVAEAYPEKMVNIICDFIKTKEIFIFDYYRWFSENECTNLFFNDDIFAKERKKSNSLAHRKIKLDDTIINLQIEQSKLTDEEFAKQKNKIYKSIDEVTKGIDTWQTEKKINYSSYFKMDLRRYNIKKENENIKGRTLYSLTPIIPKDIKQLSSKQKEVEKDKIKYVELQLWSCEKLKNNQNSMDYSKYLNIKDIYTDLMSLWKILSDNYENGSDYNNVYIYELTAACTSTVLLRDYYSDLNDQEREQCRKIIFTLAKKSVKITKCEINVPINELEAIIVGLITMINDNNRYLINENNPLCLLLQLVLLNMGDKSNINRIIAKNIWNNNQQYGWQFLYLFSLIAEKYEQDVIKNPNNSFDVFIEKNKKVITEAFSKKIVDYSQIDFKKMNYLVAFNSLLMIPYDIKEAPLIAEMTCDNVMKNAFKKKEEQDELVTEHIYYYVKWFADVLLYCDDTDRKNLINLFLERADFIANDNVNNLLTSLIEEQDFNDKADEFWFIWKLLENKMIDLSYKKDVDIYKDNDVFLEKDKIIFSYLFARTEWKENVVRCKLLSKERESFFEDFTKRTHNFKATLFSIIKLLNTIGKETYFESGVYWIYNLIQKDIECKCDLYINTLYYLEEYIGKFVSKYKIHFKEDKQLRKIIQTILEYMVNQGSSIAFFIREEI